MKFYVYTMSDLGNIFYIGKGTNQRMFIHEKKYYKGVKSNNNSSLYEKIKSIIESGNVIEYNKVFETDDEIEAYKFETKLIESIGLDNLCNLTIDYFKTSVSEMVKLGLKKSEKWKKVIENKRTDEMREYYRQINLGENNPRFGKKNTKEHNDAVKKSLINIPKSDEHKRKISESIIGIKRSDETKLKLSNSLKSSKKFQDVVKSEEFKNKHRNNTKKRHENLITYFFKHFDEIVIHKGGLKNMSNNYDISFYQLKRLRYGEIDEYNGWVFVSLQNDSFNIKK
jgi:hypothetical protein